MKNNEIEDQKREQQQRILRELIAYFEEHPKVGFFKGVSKFYDEKYSDKDSIKRNTKLHLYQMMCKEEVCGECGSDEDVTVDHIVPIYMLERFETERLIINQWKYEREDNFRFLCLRCNRKKAADIDVRNPITYKIIREVLDRAEKYFIEKH